MFILMISQAILKILIFSVNTVDNLLLLVKFPIRNETEYPHRGSHHFVLFLFPSPNTRKTYFPFFYFRYIFFYLFLLLLLFFFFSFFFFYASTKRRATYQINLQVVAKQQQYTYYSVLLLSFS